MIFSLRPIVLNGCNVYIWRKAVLTHCRGGSRVDQILSRNYSNVFKLAFAISQVLYFSSRNQLSFFFYCLYEMKYQGRNLFSFNGLTKKRRKSVTLTNILLALK